MNDDELAAALAAATQEVNAGEEARARRRGLVGQADQRGWTQQRIAEAAGITQQAIAKTLGKTPGHPR